MGNTNLVDRLAFTHDPAEVQDVFSASDLPDMILANDGVMRSPIVLGRKYIIHKTFVWPRILVPANPVEGIVITEINSISQNVQILLDGDTTPHFWGRDISNFRFTDSGIIDISNGGAGRGTVFFDLVGQGPDISATQPSGVLFLIATGLLAPLEVGRVVDVAVGAVQSGWFFPERGLVARNIVPGFGQLLNNIIYFQVGVPMTTPMVCYQGAQTTMTATSGNIQLGSSDSAFCVDSAATGGFEFLGLAYLGTAFGDFFRPDISEAITAFANADIAFTSVTDSSVNPGVDSTITFSSIQKFTRGQNVLLAGVVGTYDGAHTIVRVGADESSFDVNVAFGATTTGNVKVTRVTVVDHGLVRGETQVISGTTSYNQTSEVLFRVDDDNFDIPIAFVADDATGTVVSTSQDSMTVGVDVTACGAQRNSRVIGAAIAKDNAAVTTINDVGVFVPFNLTLALAASNIERCTLTNTTTAEIRLDDTTPFSGFATLNVTISSSGGTQDFIIRVVKNGSVLSDDIVQGASVGSDGLNISLVVPVTGVTNDLFRGEIANDSGTSNCVIEQLSFIVS